MAESSSGGGRRKTAFVRLEKPTYIEDIQRNRESNEQYGLPTDFLIESQASQKRKAALKRAEKLGGVPANVARAEAEKFSRTIAAVEQGASTPAKVEQLRRLHAISSKSSPYISATPTFTTGSGGQLHYLDANLKQGHTGYVTLHASSRPITENRTNSRERELLVPGGERRDEMQGMLRVKPSRDGKNVHAMFIDLTGEKPRLFTGRKAVGRFLELNPPAPPPSEQAARTRFPPLGPKKSAASAAPRPKVATATARASSSRAMPPIAPPKKQPAPRPAAPGKGPARAPAPAGKSGDT